MAKKLILLMFAPYFFMTACLDSSLSLADSNHTNTSEEIALDQATQIAEKFIRDQGYTDVPFILSKDDIVFESLEWTTNVDEILRGRSGTLSPMAAGAKKDGSKWIVAFRYSRMPIASSKGRAVKMDLYGNNVRVLHEDFDLSFLNSHA